MGMIKNPVSKIIAQEVVRRVTASHLQEGFVLENEERNNLVLYLMGRISFQELSQRGIKGTC